MRSVSSDITIAGAGPAGLALARELAVLGVAVTVVDPSPAATWPNRYGAWLSELPHGVPTTHEWSRPRVHARTERHLPGTYARIDGQALRHQLLLDLTGHGGRLLAGMTRQMRTTPRGQTVTLDDGSQVDSRVVIDCTGRGALMQGGSEPTAWQTAYGVLAKVDAHPWEQDEMVFMDFSDDHLGAAAAEGVPTFLYALPLAPDLVFVEETSLAARNEPGMGWLEARLNRRLEHLGIHTTQVLDVERCRIGMNRPVPAPGPVLGFGASAGLVHPASGYQLARSLHLAPRVAQVLARGLDQDPAAAVAEAWQVIWPESARRTRVLHDLGLELLLSLEGPALRRFFEAFFRIPEASWRTWLDAGASPAATATTMARVMSQLDLRLKGRVLSQVLGHRPDRILAALNPLHGGTP